MKQENVSSASKSAAICAICLALMMLWAGFFVGAMHVLNGVLS